MAIRILSKSNINEGGEELYFCTDERVFQDPASEFFLMRDNDTIDIDEVIECPALEDLPLPFDRILQAVS